MLDQGDGDQAGDQDGGRCRPWRGPVDRLGYGFVRVGRGRALAHRLAWRLAGLELPAGWRVRPCRALRHCVNVAHLELLPRRPRAPH